MVAQPKNKAEADAMRSALDQYERTQAQERYDATVARYAPLRDIVTSKPFTTLRDKLAEQVANFADVDAVDVHLRNLPGFMDRLAAAVDAAVTRPPILGDPAAPPTS